MISALLQRIAAQGARGAVVPFSRVADLKQDMQALKDGDFHTDWLDRMAGYIAQEENKFIPDSVDFTPRSIISVAIPSPKLILPFVYRGREVLCTVPPHYHATGPEINGGEMEQYLQDYLTPLGYHAVMAATCFSCPLYPICLARRTTGCPCSAWSGAIPAKFVWSIAPQGRWIATAGW